MKQPVVLQIIPELGPGGAEQGCIDVGAAIKSSGGRAIVLSHGGSRLHELSRRNVEHIDLPVHSKNPFVMWLNIFKIKKIIKQEKVNVVHVRSRAPAWSAYFACKGTNAKFMTTCHAPYNIGTGSFSFFKRLYNSVMVKGQRIIAISGMVSSYIQANYRFDPSVIRLIHRGISTDNFSPNTVSAERVISLSTKWRIPEGSDIVMLPGRLTRWKGHHVLIKAIANIKRDDLFCILIGSDQGRSEYRKELEQSIQDKGLGGHIRIVDHCDDMPAAYMLAGAVVSASTDPEGFGRIPVEAQAMGRPIIATDHGGAQETIKRGETGWLVPPNDDQLMADAIREALSLQAEHRDVLAERSMQHVHDNFTVEIMVRKTLDVYNELLETNVSKLA